MIASSIKKLCRSHWVHTSPWMSKSCTRRLASVSRTAAAGSNSNSVFGRGWCWVAAGAGVSAAAAALYASRRLDERATTVVSADASAPDASAPDASGPMMGERALPVLLSLPIVDVQSSTLGLDLDIALSNMGFVVLTNHGRVTMSTSASALGLFVLLCFNLHSFDIDLQLVTCNCRVQCCTVARQAYISNSQL
jgi:hypothetical protein